MFAPIVVHRLQHYHAINNINSNIEKVVTPQHQHYYHGHQHQHLQINNMLTIEPPKEILSVSGKKKCSYCDDELGMYLTLSSNTKKKCSNICILFLANLPNIIKNYIHIRE